MLSLVLAALLAIASGAASRKIQTKELQYGFCEGASRPFTFDELVVEPYPIVLQSGTVLHVAIGLILNEPIPVGATVTVKMAREGLIHLPFPCIPIEDFYFGSW
jgi:hypothetical protein